MKKVSIIVPVYNGENHIENCINKLCNQTYKDIEIIVINDGSTDSTKVILERISKKYKNIVVINKDNEGVSAARNDGIKKSSGDYILFVDSDDELIETATEKLMDFIEDQDIAFFGYKVIGDGNRKNDTMVLKELEDNNIDSNTILKKIISTKNNIYGYIWRCIYSSKLLKDNSILFARGIKISEDYLFLLQVVKNSNKIGIINEELYKYNLGESSMSLKYIPSLLHDMTYVNDWMYSNVVLNNNDLLLGYYCSCANTYLRYLQNEYRKKDSFIATYRRIKPNKRYFVTAIKKTWYKNNCYNFKTRLSIMMFRFHLDILYSLLFYLKINRRG